MRDLARQTHRLLREQAREPSDGDLPDFGAVLRRTDSLRRQLAQKRRSDLLRWPIKPVDFTSVAEAIELAWHVREGLLGLVGKSRPEGSTLITEGVCFPPERLAQGAHDVQELLAKHGFMQGLRSSTVLERHRVN